MNTHIYRYTHIHKYTHVHTQVMYTHTCIAYVHTHTHTAQQHLVQDRKHSQVAKIISGKSLVGQYSSSERKQTNEITNGKFKDKP